MPCRKVHGVRLAARHLSEHDLRRSGALDGPMPLPDPPVLVAEFRKGDRTLSLDVRTLPHGRLELRCLETGEMIWTRVCKTGADLRDEVQRVIVDAESRG